MKLRKTPTWCIVAILFGVMFFLIQGLSWSSPSYSARDYHILKNVNQAKIVMIGMNVDEGNYDNFNCDYEDMRTLCKQIDISYGPQNDQEPVIVHDAVNNSQAACIYSPLNKEKGWFKKKNFWYCADSEGHAGFTSIDPGSPGYCVEGESAVCPPFLSE